MEHLPRVRALRGSGLQEAEQALSRLQKGELLACLWSGGVAMNA